MPEPTPPVDPFELGDTELYPSLEAPPAGAPVEPPKPVVENPPAAPDAAAVQPRDERGRFVTPAEAPAAPVVHQHPGYLLLAARDLGFGEEEIADLPTEKLHALVWKFNQQQQRNREQLITQRTLDQATAPSATGGRVETGATQPVSTAPSEDSIDLGVKDEDYDPALIGGLKKVFAAQAKQIKELQSQLQALGQREGQREYQTAAQAADAAFEKLGDKVTYGEGAGDELKPESPELARRRMVIEQARRMVGAKATYHQVIVAIPKAHAVIYGHHAPTAAVPPAAPPGTPPVSPEAWTRGGVQRPTARTPEAEPKGEKLAKQNLAAKLREEGLTAGSDDEEMDGFLG